MGFSTGCGAALQSSSTNMEGGRDRGFGMPRSATELGDQCCLAPHTNPQPMRSAPQRLFREVGHPFVKICSVKDSPHFGVHGGAAAPPSWLHKSCGPSLWLLVEASKYRELCLRKLCLARPRASTAASSSWAIFRRWAIMVYIWSLQLSDQPNCSVV